MSEGAYPVSNKMPFWAQLGMDVRILENQIDLAVKSPDPDVRAKNLKLLFKTVESSTLFRQAAEKKITRGLNNGWGMDLMIWGRAQALRVPVTYNIWPVPVGNKAKTESSQKPTLG